MLRSWRGAVRRRCRPGAWSSARGGRRSQELVGNCVQAVWPKGVGPSPGSERMDGEEGGTGTRLLFPRELLGLHGVQSQSACWCSSVGCSIIPVREIEVPECLLILLPLAHLHCCTLGSPPPLRNHGDSPLSGFSHSSFPRLHRVHTLGLPVSCVQHITLTVIP